MFPLARVPVWFCCWDLEALGGGIKDDPVEAAMALDMTGDEEDAASGRSAKN